MDAEVCDISRWAYVKARKLYTVRCYRSPRMRYTTVLGPREVEMLIKLRSKEIPYDTLGLRAKVVLERLEMKKLVTIEDNTVKLTRGGASVARILAKFFEQKNKLSRHKGDRRSLRRSREWEREA